MSRRLDLVILIIRVWNLTVKFHEHEEESWNRRKSRNLSQLQISDEGGINRKYICFDVFTSIRTTNDFHFDVCFSNLTSFNGSSTKFFSDCSRSNWKDYFLGNQRRSNGIKNGINFGSFFKINERMEKRYQISSHERRLSMSVYIFVEGILVELNRGEVYSQLLSALLLQRRTTSSAWPLICDKGASKIHRRRRSRVRKARRSGRKL